MAYDPDPNPMAIRAPLCRVKDGIENDRIEEIRTIYDPNPMAGIRAPFCRVKDGIS